MADPTNKWSQPAAPPAPMFFGKKERDLVKQVNDELAERVVGQAIAYYPISLEESNFNEIYGEALEKVSLSPIRVFAYVTVDNEQSNERYGYEYSNKLTVNFHRKRLTADQDLYVRVGDYVQYGDKFYEIVKTYNDTRYYFGQVEHKFQISAECIEAREGAFRVVPELTRPTAASGAVGDTSSPAPRPAPYPPLEATYITVTPSPKLPNERVLTAGTGIVLTDGGANGTLTIQSAGSSGGIFTPDSATTAYTTSSVKIGDAVTPTHTLTVAGGISGSGVFQVVGNSIIGGTLGVTGAATFGTDSVVINGPAGTISGSAGIQVVGAGLFGNALSVTGAISGAVGITGSDGLFDGQVSASIFYGSATGLTGVSADGVDVTSSTGDLNYPIVFTEGFQTDGTLGLGGNTSLIYNAGPAPLLSSSAGIQAVGATIFGNTLTVSGAVSGAAGFTGASWTSDGTISGSSTLQTVGAATLGSTLNVTGAISGAVGITGSAFQTDGQVSASIFYGDGSGLTGVDSVSGSARHYSATGLETSGYLRVSGSTTLAGAVSSSAGAVFVQSISSSGDVAVTGNVHAGIFYGSAAGLTGISSDAVDVTSSTGDLDYPIVFTEGFQTDGTLGLGGNTALVYNPNDAILSSSAGAQFVGATTLGSTLNVTGVISGAVGVTASAFLTDGRIAAQIVSASSTVDAGAASFYTMELTSVPTSRILSVDGGDVTSSANLTFDLSNNLEVTGNIYLGGPVSGSSTLQAVGATILGSTLTVSGTISGASGVEGSFAAFDTMELLGSDFSNNQVLYLSSNDVMSNAGLTFDGSNFAVVGTMSGSSTLQAVGATILGSTLNVSGSQTLAGAISSSAGAVFVNSISSSGDIAITGAYHGDGQYLANISADGVDVTSSTGDLNYPVVFTEGFQSDGSLGLGGNTALVYNPNDAILSSSAGAQFVGDTILGSTLNVTGAISGAVGITGSAFYTDGQVSASNLTYDSSRDIPLQVTGNFGVSGSGALPNTAFAVHGSLSGNPNPFFVHENASGQVKVGIGSTTVDDITGTLHVTTALDDSAVMFESTDNLVGFRLKDPQAEWSMSTSTSDTGPSGGFSWVQKRRWNGTSYDRLGSWPRMAINIGGEVSIGTEQGGADDAADGFSAQAMLHISSSLSSSGDFMSGDGNLLRVDGVEPGDGTVSTHILYVTGGVNRVGINTSTPNDSLAVVGGMSGSSTLQAVGATILGSTLNVSGSQTLAGAISSSAGAVFVQSISSSNDLAVTGNVHAAQFYGGGAGITGISSDAVDVTSSAGDINYPIVFTEGFQTDGTLGLGGNTGLVYNPNDAVLSSSAGIQIVGATILGNTLNVSGAVSGAAAFTGASWASDGTISGSGTLQAVGATTLGSTLAVSGNLGVGTDPASNVVRLEVAADQGYGGGISVSQYDNLNFGNGAELVVKRSRGTQASPLTVADGDTIGELDFFGHDGTTFRLASSIVSQLDNTVGASQVPANLLFNTADSAGTLTERLRITSGGFISGSGTLHNVGATTLGSTLNVTGAISGSSTLEAVGATILGSTLNVSGSQTLAGAISSSAGAVFVNSISSSGDIAITGSYHGDGQYLANISADGVDVTSSTGDLNYPIVFTEGFQTDGTLGLAGNTGLVYNPNDAILSSSAGIQAVGATILGNTLSVSGNVGVGTSSPSALLHVSSSGDEALFRVDGAAAGNVLFVTGGVEAYSGSVGINTDTPGSTLDVITTDTGSMRVLRSDGEGLIIGMAAGAPYTNFTGIKPVGSSIYMIAQPVGGGHTQISADTGDSVFVFGGHQDTSNSITVPASSTKATIDINTDTLVVSDNSYSQTFGVPAQLHVSSSGDEIILQADGAAAGTVLFVTGSGKVGIGTTTPGDLYTLDMPVSASTARLGRVETGAWPVNTQYGYLGHTNQDHTGYNYNLLLGINGSLDLNSQGDPLGFRTGTNASLKAAITVDGNFGIGPNAGHVSGFIPSALLQVSSSQGSLFQVDSESGSVGTVLYVSGGAHGRVGIGTSTPTDTLTVVGAMSGSSTLQAVGATTLGSTLAVSGNLGVGTDPASNVVRLEVAADQGYGGGISVSQYDNSYSINGAELVVKRARGTQATPLTVADGDTIGELDFFGHDGTTFRLASSIVSQLDNTVGASQVPANLLFNTADSAGTLTERLRITSGGFISGSGTLHNVGTVTLGSILNITGAVSGAVGITGSAFQTDGQISGSVVNVDTGYFSGDVTVCGTLIGCSPLKISGAVDIVDSGGNVLSELGSGPISGSGLFNSGLGFVTQGTLDITGSSTLAGTLDVGNVATFSSGMIFNRTAIAGNYSVLSTDYYLGCDTTSAPGGITLTLPGAAYAGVGTTYIVKDEGGSSNTNTITIAGNGADTIDGQASVIINSARGAINLYSNGGTNWCVY